MRTVFAYPGNMTDAQNAGLALWEAGALGAFVTTTAYCSDGPLGRMVHMLPTRLSQRIERQLLRRSIPDVPPDLVRSYPVWEIARTFAQKVGANPSLVDAIWDFASQRFDAHVARKYVPNSEAVCCFEYTALATFKAAKSQGRACILHLPALDNAAFNAIWRRERELWSDIVDQSDNYFEARFTKRQERRAQEIALADVIICNSSLTARSHIEGGADPAKTFAVPLGAPPPIAEVANDTGRVRRPLRVLYAGPFSLRKGAHYLLQAWRKLEAGPHANLDVYGALTLPQRLTASGTDGIVFHGSVPRQTLFTAYEQADVLVFPTLSDGFGDGRDGSVGARLPRYHDRPSRRVGSADARLRAHRAVGRFRTQLSKRCDGASTTDSDWPTCATAPWQRPAAANGPISDAT